MDLTSIIKDLRAELAVVNGLISSFELLARLRQLRTGPLPAGLEKAMGRRRGRKFMGPEERKQVSERMKRYWKGRKDKP